jgi:YVTN family beta-propeller protein
MNWHPGTPDLSGRAATRDSAFANNPPMNWQRGTPDLSGRTPIRATPCRVNPRTIRATGLALLLYALPSPLTRAATYTPTGKEPVYIGSQACAKCHDGPQMGHQFSKWRLSAHARAYTALSQPEAREITKLSGITEEPHRAKMCLGCHATASEEEDWRHGEEFHLEDGLQCEVCHGPGSEYAVREIMKNKERALANGLRITANDDCRICHRPKGSHEAVLKKQPFDLDQAMLTIAHPLPKEKPDPAPSPDFPRTASPHKFTGVMACAACHTGPKFNFQFSLWRRSKHAQAYADLSTQKAADIAAKDGVKDDPQKTQACLKCHATGATIEAASLLKGFDLTDGVQCESCHGPGEHYSAEAVMLDKATAAAKGLLKVGPETCAPCHANAHGKPFDYPAATKEIAHPTKPTQTTAAEPVYKNPLNLAFTPNGRELWVTCEASACVAVLDPASRTRLLEISVGGQPHDVAFTPDGKLAFVSNRLDDNVSVIDTATHKVTATIEVGDEPHGLLVDRQSRHLYVLNTSIDSISVIDVATRKEVKRLSASRSPWSLAESPDGSQIIVTHALSRFTGDRKPALSEITVIDPDHAIVRDRVLVPGANLLQGVAWHPSGDYALIPLLRTKNLIPMTRINHGWTISNGLGVFWRDGSIDQVLLDQNDLCFPDPIDVVITPDGHYALVTSSSTDRVAVVDLNKLISLLKSASPHEREHVLPNHTGKPAEYVVRLLPVNAAPRGLALSPDGATAGVASMLDDSVTVIDARHFAVLGRIDLGGARELTRRRRGEKLFHSANIAFRRQFSCSSCHPDGHIDNLVYDIEDDGIGMGPIDNRTLRGVNDMAPYKWTGINPSLRRQCGPRLAVFITRIQPFTAEQLDDLHYYLCSIPRPPNRYRKLGEDLSETQRRGKTVFERARKNDGSVIAPERRCNTCHPPPLYTDGKVHNVGTKFAYDRESKFDAPHLLNIYDSAPYLHNGIARTLEEIWTVYNPYDEHGVTNDMTKDQLNDLIEYLKTL